MTAPKGTFKAEDVNKTVDDSQTTEPVGKQPVEKTEAQQAEDAKQERKDMQIPERKDDVVGAGEKTPTTNDSTAAKESNAAVERTAAETEEGPGKRWADYASAQEELWKKNTGQPIERGGDGRVKP